MVYRAIGFIALLFSLNIYLAAGNSLKQLLEERLKNKALAIKEIYDQHNIVAEKIITSIPEQSEYVFDQNNQLIFAINDLHDFDFKEDFFRSVSQKRNFILNTREVQNWDTRKVTFLRSVKERQNW